MGCLQTWLRSNEHHLGISYLLVGYSHSRYLSGNEKLVLHSTRYTKEMHSWAGRSGTGIRSTISSGLRMDYVVHFQN